MPFTWLAGIFGDFVSSTRVSSADQQGIIILIDSMKTSLLATLALLLAASTAPAQLFESLQKFANRIKVSDPQIASQTGREGPKSICLEDLDADGNLDFFVSNLDGSVSVAYGAGGLSFSSPQHFGVSPSTLR